MRVRLSSLSHFISPVSYITRLEHRFPCLAAADILYQDLAETVEKSDEGQGVVSCSMERQFLDLILAVNHVLSFGLVVEGDF